MAYLLEQNLFVERRVLLLERFERQTRFFHRGVVYRGTAAVACAGTQIAQHHNDHDYDDNDRKQVSA